MVCSVSLCLSDLLYRYIYNQTLHSYPLPPKVTAVSWLVCGGLAYFSQNEHCTIDGLVLPTAQLGMDEEKQLHLMVCFPSRIRVGVKTHSRLQPTELQPQRAGYDNTQFPKGRRAGTNMRE